MNDLLYTQHGFTEFVRKKILSLMGITPADKYLIQILHDVVIIPYQHKIIDEFYQYLFNHRGMRELIEKHSTLDKLKVTQHRYLLSFGIDCGSKEYFEYRLKVGYAHARIGLHTSLYLATYRQLQHLLIKYIPSNFSKKSSDYAGLVNTIIKISSLDISIAVETYHNKTLQNMSESISDLVDERNQLSDKVEKDELTGSASRTHTNEILALRLSEVKTLHIDCCLAMVDLDFFKAINDSYGHVTGDNVLQDVAARIMGTVREHDLVGRYGGEEFVIILPGSDINLAKQIIERIRRNIADQPFKVGKRSIPVTISIGLTKCKQDDNDKSLIERADTALYQAKDNGRNQIQIL